MTIFYLPYKKYNIPSLKIHKTITKKHLQNAIDANTDFCGNEESITRDDLKYDIPHNLVIFSITNRTIDGILVFSVNVSTLNIQGLCVVKRKNKIGSLLLNEVKRFAKRNNLEKIKLTCYGDVHKFYERNGFVIESHSLASADSDDSYSAPKQAYHMTQIVPLSSLSKSASRSLSTKIKAAKRLTKFLRTRTNARSKTNNKTFKFLRSRTL